MSRLATLVIVIAGLVVIGVPDGNSFWDFNVLEVVAAVAIVIAAIISGLRFSQTRPWRMWDVRFFEGSDVIFGQDFPPSEVYKHRWPKGISVTAPNECADIRVRVKATSGVDVSEIGGRLVERVWFPRVYRIWGWQPISPNQSGVTYSDARDEQWRRDDDYQVTSRPKPKQYPDGANGWRLKFPGQSLRVLKGDSLWITVTLHVDKEWTGHFEFQGPTASGGRGYKRRKITVKPSS